MLYAQIIYQKSDHVRPQFWEISNKRPTSFPKFEVSALDAYSKIYSISFVISKWLLPELSFSDGNEIVIGQVCNKVSI